MRQKEAKRARIGIYTLGLKHYWGQFEGLHQRMLAYGEFISEEVRKMDADVFFYGLVYCEQEGEKAGEYFAAAQVDLVFAHAATYVTSSSVLPVHQICKAPVIILNLQSLLTAKGVPCAGEGDLKTCLAMKMCDIIKKGGSFCEIVVTDYEEGTILLGHDGPFHLEISQGKPVLRGMGLYHGKQGNGVSVEAKVKTGDITTLGCTQTWDGKLKLIITQAQSVDGTIMTIGNTQTPVRFKKDPDSYMDEWFAQSPTHHFAMSIDHNGAIFEKAAQLLDIAYVTIDK